MFSKRQPGKAWSHLILALVLAAACGDDGAAPHDAGMGEDAGRDAGWDAGTDASVPRDGAEPTDSGDGMDAGGDTDAGGGTDSSVALDGGTGDDVQVAAGQAHACALVAGDVRCWGANGSGQLGDGTTTDRPAPVDVTGLSGVQQITAGGAHTCALLDDGSARCWGANQWGQLGDGTTTDRHTPVDVVRLSGIAQIVAGGGQLGTHPMMGHTCARMPDGTVYCWGANGDGQLGHDGGRSVTTPTEISVSWDVADVAAAHEHTCAALSDGTVGCWGNSRCGALGIRGSGPSMVRGATGALGIEAGAGFTCIDQVGDEISCWGRDLARGQCSMSVIILTPMSVPMVSSSIVGMGVGRSHKCAAFASDGSTRCWGSNDRGQLGDGSPSDTMRDEPAAVPGVTGAVSIASGWLFTVVALSDGSFRSWGANGRGQLGDGSTTDSDVPVDVMW